MALLQMICLSKARVVVGEIGNSSEGIHDQRTKSIQYKVISSDRVHFRNREVLWGMIHFLNPEGGVPLVCSLPALDQSQPLLRDTLEYLAKRDIIYKNSPIPSSVVHDNDLPSR